LAIRPASGRLPCFLVFLGCEYRPQSRKDPLTGKKLEQLADEGGGAGSSNSTSKVEEKADDRAERQKIEQALSITALDLFNDFDQNQVKANATYKRHPIHVEGTVETINVDSQDNPLIWLNTWDERLLTAFKAQLAEHPPPPGYGIRPTFSRNTNGVKCRFKESDSKQVGAIKRGQKVVIRGLCMGMSEGMAKGSKAVLLDGCALVERKEDVKNDKEKHTPAISPSSPKKEQPKMKDKP
jgi:hypothetical protein